MNTFSHCQRAWGRLLWLQIAALLLGSASRALAEEETFTVLQTRTAAYTNVTVTKKTKTWIMILHSRGAGNIPITDLPPEVQQKLGYSSDSQESQTNEATRQVKQMLASVGLPQPESLGQVWHKCAPVALLEPGSNPTVVYAVWAVLLVLHLLFSYCCMLICHKAHTEPGALVWLPVFQLFPLLRAAGMSSMWFFALLVPVVNLFAPIVWFVNIVKARGKSLWVALLLALPVTGPFAFLYLAFSSPAPIEIEKEPEPDLMVLDAG